MKELSKLSPIQRNILIASIIGDGEITKLYPGSRRKNNSYREHYGVEQEEYRIWKQSIFPDLLYLTPKSQTLRSRSHPLFTELYPHFYTSDGNKKIPKELLSLCNDPYFLFVLFLDDGSLSITTTKNDNNKRIYLTPHIFLYLQNYPKNELILLKNHIQKQFNLDFKLNKRKDGHGYILRFTSVQRTFQFLNLIAPCAKELKTMRYKTDWNYRLELEKEKYERLYPSYQIFTSSSDRNKKYSQEEINLIIELKKAKKTDQYIASRIGRSYWSVVYKISDLRKSKLL